MIFVFKNYVHVLILDLLRVSTFSKYKWMIENLLAKLNEELCAFISLSGSIVNIPDYIINYSASTAGNKVCEKAETILIIF